MDRKYFVFKNTVLQARFLTMGKAIQFASGLNGGDIRVVSTKTNKVVWINGGVA